MRFKRGANLFNKMMNQNSNAFFDYTVSMIHSYTTGSLIGNDVFYVDRAAVSSDGAIVCGTSICGSVGNSYPEYCK